MSEEKATQPETTAVEEKVTSEATEAQAAGAAKEAAASDDAAKKAEAPAQDEKPKRATKRNFRSRAPRRRERVKPEFEQKIIALRRVTRVMAGGRRFSFSVSLVIGDRQGRVGLGQGKATDTSLAIEKAFNDAKRNLVKLQLTDDRSIAYESRAKFNAAVVTLAPNYGRGLVSGSAVRTILEFAGITNTTSRVLTRSRNKMNNARATMKALEPFVIARGKDAMPAKKKADESKGSRDRTPSRSPRGKKKEA
jgi:small subunit ribosomal protein S5